ncbi:MAG: PEGA domain-containing protein [Myxococcales bacterium]|nr:PEGA domain-containing protein [Myxococcales bacterium]
MLARRVIALSVDKAFGKVVATALRAAGGVVELHTSLEALGAGDIQAALIVVHLDGALMSCVEDLALRMRDDARLIAILPAHALAPAVDAMKLSDKVSGVLVQSEMRPGDLAAMATRILAGDIFGLEKLVPWGTRVYSTLVGDYQEKSLCIAQLMEFAELMGVRRKYRDNIERCLDEMLMNALYDAPVDEHGKPVFADIPTKSRIGLRMEQKVVVQYACDGRSFAMSVRDSFGALERGTILRYLHKCLHSEQQIDRKTGGAGLGLYFIASSASRFLVNVLPGVATECVVTHDLEAPKVELEAFGYFVEKIDAAGRLAAGPSRLLPQGTSHPVERRASAPRAPRGVIAGLSAAIVLLVALIALVAYPRFARPATTSVRISVDPAGATVELDGRVRGVATAGGLVVTGLEVGRAYRVAAHKDGHSPAETVFQPADGPPTSLDLHLVARTASIEIDSDPRGATILVGGRELGVTPTTITSLPPGSDAQLVVTHTGYAPVERTIRVPAAGAEGHLTLALAIDPSFASLAVTSTPPGADIYLDGQRQAGQVTPVRELLVEAGRAHQISLRLPKHAPITVTVTPPAGARAVPVTAALVPGAAIALTANVEARGTVVGAPGCAKKALPFDCPVAAGRYQVDVEAIRPGGTVRRTAVVGDDTVAIDVQFGTVEAPAGGALLIGGRKVNRAALEEGRRTLKVIDADGTERNIDVKVTAGKSTTIP